jgi:hypothetical protein
MRSRYLLADGEEVPLGVECALPAPGVALHPLDRSARVRLMRRVRAALTALVRGLAGGISWGAPVVTATSRVPPTISRP